MVITALGKPKKRTPNPILPKSQKTPVVPVSPPQLQSSKAGCERSSQIKIEPSVVRIITPSGSKVGLGSGFIIKSGGILTNYHVIFDTISSTIKDTILVQFMKIGNTSPKICRGNVQYYDASMDIALLQLSSQCLNIGYSYLHFYIPPNDDAYRGREVVVAGYPLSANVVEWTPAGQAGGWEYEPNNNQRFLRIQVGTNLGNSGGPVIDCETGKVLGILTARIVDRNKTGAGVDLAIDSNTIINWLNKYSILWR
jgi:S1-C subfamily serine protease